MLKRLTTLLAALMLLASVVAGCGDDSDSDSSGSGDTAAETQTEDATVEETDTGDGDITPPANLDEAIDRCKENVDDPPQLSDETKATLKDTCEKAGSLDQEEIRDRARETCETVVKESIPEGSPGREAALSSCANRGQ